MQQNILIVEDEADIAESLHYNLKREGIPSDDRRVWREGP